MMTVFKFMETKTHIIMKSKIYLLIMAVTAALFFSACNPKPEPLKTVSGASLQDSILPKTLFKLVHEGSSYYFAYYYTNSLVVDTTHTPPGLTLQAQSAYYNATNSSSVLHNGSTTSQVSSTISVNTDTVTASYAGPFDIVNGHLYTYKGYLHYCYSKAAGGADSTVCPVAEIVYFDQNGAGAPMGIGFVTQTELHGPKPPAAQ